MQLLKLKKCCKVPHPEQLFEAYAVGENMVAANVSTDKIEDVLVHFIAAHQQEPLFFILEIPSRQDDEQEIAPGVLESFHKDVYYIDGCTPEEALGVLSRVANIVFEDGLCAFGFGGHESGEEIMFDKYNIVTVVTGDPQQYCEFFAMHDIPQTDNLVTAWDTFTQDAPGQSKMNTVKGKNIYDIPAMFEEWGMYLAEQREA